MSAKEDNSNRKPRGYWTKETCLDEIEQRYREGKKLNPSAVKKEHGSLYTKTLQHIGDWKKAVEMCGIDYNSVITKKPNGYWTKERIINEIKRVSEIDGDLSAANMLAKYSDLYRVAIRDFGSWEEALKHKSINYEEHIRKRHNYYWDKDNIDTEIDRLISEGSELSATHISKINSSIYKGAVRHYGSWRNALERKGIPYESVRLDYNKPQYYGYVFERLVFNIMDDLGVQYEKKPTLDNGLIPDIVFANGKIYDVKLSNYTDWHGLTTLEKYGEYSEGIGIIFLRGEHSEEVYEIGDVKFKSVYYFINQMPEDMRDYYHYKADSLLNVVNERQAVTWRKNSDV